MSYRWFWMFEFEVQCKKIWTFLSIFFIKSHVLLISSKKLSWFISFADFTYSKISFSSDKCQTRLLISRSILNFPSIQRIVSTERICRICGLKIFNFFTCNLKDTTWEAQQQELSYLWSIRVSRHPYCFLQVICFLLQFWVILQMQNYFQLWELESQIFTF